MEKQIEENGIVYNLVGDYYIPDLRLPPQKEEPKYGRYGRLRLEYIRRKHVYGYYLLLKGESLNQYLNKLDLQATKMFDRLVKQMAKEQDVTEQLKADDQMKWVGMMNNIRSAANEVVLNDLIYN